MSNESRLRILETFIDQLEAEKFRDECQALINLASPIEEKIKILKKLKEELWPSQEPLSTQA